MSGYGKWISAPPYGADGIKRWQFVRHTPSTPDGFRELAAEFIAWADEHDMVTITLPRKTVVFNAGPHVP